MTQVLSLVLWAGVPPQPGEGSLGRGLEPAEQGGLRLFVVGLNPGPFSARSVVTGAWSDPCSWAVWESRSWQAGARSLPEGGIRALLRTRPLPGKLGPHCGSRLGLLVVAWAQVGGA